MVIECFRKLSDVVDLSAVLIGTVNFGFFSRSGTGGC